MHTHSTGTHTPILHIRTQSLPHLDLWCTHTYTHTCHICMHMLHSFSHTYTRHTGTISHKMRLYNFLINSFTTELNMHYDNHTTQNEIRLDLEVSHLCSKLPCWYLNAHAHTPQTDTTHAHPHTKDINAHILSHKCTPTHLVHSCTTHTPFNAH